MFVGVRKLTPTYNYYNSMGVNISASTQEQAVKFVQSEHTRWAKIIQASGMKAD